MEYRSVGISVFREVTKPDRLRTTARVPVEALVEVVMERSPFQTARAELRTYFGSDRDGQADASGTGWAAGDRRSTVPAVTDDGTV